MRRSTLIVAVLVFLIFTLASVNSLVYVANASSENSAAAALFASEIGMTKIVNQGFSISNSKVVYLNVEGHYRSPSELHYLFTNVTSMFAVKLQQLKGPVFGKEMFELGNSTLRSIMEAYEAAIGSNVRDLLFANVSVLRVSNGTYQIVAFYKVDYNGVLTDQAIEVSVWINSTYAKIKIVDPVSMMFHRKILVPTSPNPQVKSSIIREIDEVTGVNWSDVMITPVLYKYGNAVIPAYKVEAYRPINDSFAMFLTAYVLPNMTVLSKNVTVSPYFGLGSSTPTPSKAENVGVNYAPLYAGLLIATLAIATIWAQKIKLIAKPIMIAFVLFIIISSVLISEAYYYICTPQLSSNWSGYLVYLYWGQYPGWISAVFPVGAFNGSYNPVSRIEMGQWVGFGGYNKNTSLIQAGVGYFYPDAWALLPYPPYLAISGYFIWYETLPSAANLVYPVSPGEYVYTLIENLSYLNATSPMGENSWLIAMLVTSSQGAPEFSYAAFIPNYTSEYWWGTADFIVEGAGLYTFNLSSFTISPLELSIDDAEFNGMNLYYLAFDSTYHVVPVIEHVNITFLFMQYSINYVPTFISPPGNFTVINGTTPICAEYIYHGS